MCRGGVRRHNASAAPSRSEMQTPQPEDAEQKVSWNAMAGFVSCYCTMFWAGSSSERRDPPLLLMRWQCRVAL
jgi:hypothetical protein